MHHATLDNNGHLAIIGTRRHASLNSLTCFPLWPFQVAEGWHADEMQIRSASDKVFETPQAGGSCDMEAEASQADPSLKRGMKFRQG